MWVTLLPKTITANTLVIQEEKEIRDFSEFSMSVLFDRIIVAQWMNTKLKRDYV